MARVKVKVSPKYQIVIPKELREALKIQPGQELLASVTDGKLEFDPPRSIKELAGIAKGIKWRDDYRDRNDRF